MKKLYLIAAAIAVLMLAISPVMAADKKANTIEELAAMYDSSSCKGCHSEIYAMWEKSHHARPLMGVQDLPTHQPLAKPKGTPGATAFSPESPDKATMDTFPCFKCHLPQAITSGSDALAADIAKALVDFANNKARIAKLTINCLVCHNEKAIIHKLQDGEPVKGTVYSNMDMPNHPGGPMKKSAIFNEAIMCGQCHGLGPNLEFKNPVQCATAYGSYEHNYISGGGTKTCQECHMKQVAVGKKTFADHLIAPNFNDIAGLEKILADTITLDVDTLGYQWLRKGGDLRPMVVVNTRITQSAGHRIPDG